MFTTLLTHPHPPLCRTLLPLPSCLLGYGTLGLLRLPRPWRGVARLHGWMGRLPFPTIHRLLYTYAFFTFRVTYSARNATPRLPLPPLLPTHVYTRCLYCHASCYIAVAENVALCPVPAFCACGSSGAEKFTHSGCLGFHRTLLYLVLAFCRAVTYLFDYRRGGWWRRAGLAYSCQRSLLRCGAARRCAWPVPAFGGSRITLFVCTHTMPVLHSIRARRRVIRLWRVAPGMSVPALDAVCGIAPIPDRCVVVVQVRVLDAQHDIMAAAHSPLF